MLNGDYVLVTPARNEENFIEETITSVLAQTKLPKTWAIISDGSTDRTDDIVAQAARAHPFIKFVRKESDGVRSFGSKVRAFRMSESVLAELDFDYIGNLDADVSFQPDYFESVLRRFETCPMLGLAGGIVLELVKGRYEELRTSLNSVAGPVQLFRRSCYEDIGGYIPLRFGGIDTAAEIMARARGWEVRTFPDLKVQQHRPVSSRAGGIIKTKFRYGIAHYVLGYHPAFELLRCGYRVTDRPYLIGSTLLAVGYLWAWVTRMNKALPPKAVRYLRGEQVQRLRTICLAWRKGSLRNGPEVY